MENIVKSVKRLLDDSGISFRCIYPDCHENIKIDVSWGDWKHDHLRLRMIMQKNGFFFIDEEMTEDDGSDCYSATHTYKPAV